MYDKQLLKDLLITAIEGGSDYWMLINPIDWQKVKATIKFIEDEEEFSNLSFAEKIWEAMVFNGEDWSIRIHDEENYDYLGKLSIDSMHKAMGIMKRDYTWHYDNAINDNWDAETADAFIQLAVMGDIVYG
jgi:hypothetical protein